MSETHSNTVFYVRDTMLPQQDPPLTEKGVVKWLRENLFSGWLNTSLTLIALFIIWQALAAVGPWLLNSVWNAGSLRECRDILDGAPGACFGVINDRWHQLLFGFYPSHLYWRPVLALGLLFAALAPILFTSLPRKLLAFTAIYPFLA